MPASELLRAFFLTLIYIYIHSIGGVRGATATRTVRGISQKTKIYLIISLPNSKGFMQRKKPLPAQTARTFPWCCRA